jgi:hypothetical protein
MESTTKINVSTVKSVKKGSVNRDQYYEMYDNKRIECDNCGILILKTMLYNDLCEMCAEKSERKMKRFK